ncbi:MAG: hypothetical protein ABI175_17140, partial [Polyangiales bacterium]
MPRPRKIHAVVAAAIGGLTLLSGETRGAAPATLAAAAGPGGGLPAVGVRVDLAQKTLRIRGCASLPCDASSGESTSIPLADALDPQSARIEVLDVAGGRHVLRV